MNLETKMKFILFAPSKRPLPKFSYFRKALLNMVGLEERHNTTFLPPPALLPPTFPEFKQTPTKLSGTAELESKRRH